MERFAGAGDGGGGCPSPAYRPRGSHFGDENSKTVLLR